MKTTNNSVLHVSIAICAMMVASVPIAAVATPNTLTLACEVDIKPGSFPNSVNLKSKGVLPVAILGTDDFDVSDVDLSTLLFGDPDLGGVPVTPVNTQSDVNQTILHVSTQEMVAAGVLDGTSDSLRVTGLLLDGTPFECLDSIRIVPPNRSNGNSLQVSANPEPSTLTLAALGLLGIGWRRRKRA